MVPDFDYDGKYWTSIKIGKTYNVEFNAAGLVCDMQCLILQKGIG